MTTLEKLKCKLGFHAYDANHTTTTNLDKTHILIEVTCIRCGQTKTFIEPIGEF